MRGIHERAVEEDDDEGSEDVEREGDGNVPNASRTGLDPVERADPDPDARERQQHEYHAYRGEHRKHDEFFVNRENV